jgi:hypothetical protein
VICIVSKPGVFLGGVLQAESRAIVHSSIGGTGNRHMDFLLMNEIGRNIPTKYIIKLKRNTLFVTTKAFSAPPGGVP